MNLDVAKKLISSYVTGHDDFILKSQVAERYYATKNDILKKKIDDEKDLENPLRVADNRVAFSFHNLLVNQKASYLFTYPPIFDTKDKNINSLSCITIMQKTSYRMAYIR